MYRAHHNMCVFFSYLVSAFILTVVFTGDYRGLHLIRLCLSALTNEYISPRSSADCESGYVDSTLRERRANTIRRVTDATLKESRPPLP